MNAKKLPPVEVKCPCCEATLKVDRELGVVLSHELPPKAPTVNLEDTAGILRAHSDHVEAKFRQAVEAERVKDEFLDRKFAENLKKAKEQPIEKPLRDVDLD